MQTMKIKFKLIYIPLALIFIVGVLMMGITDYVTFGFTKETLKKPDFWVNIICTYVGIVCLILSMILIKVDNFKESNAENIMYQTNIFEFRKNEYVAPMFQKFCFDDNLKTKIKYYKYNVNKKFSKIKPTEEDLKIYYEGTDEQKHTNDYCIKMEYYDRILSKEYIERVVPKLTIKYPAISEGLIFTEVKNNNQIVDYITTNKGRKVFIDYLPRFLFSFAITLLISSVVPDLKDGIKMATIFKTVTKLFIVMSQTFFAYTYANRYNKEVTLHDIIFRDSKLNEYRVWENKQKQLYIQKQGGSE